MKPAKCYAWDESTSSVAVLIEIHHTGNFLTLLTEHLIEGYRFLTSKGVDATVEAGSGNIIGNGLLGSISEFVVYVLRRVQEAFAPPFIHCFRAPDPLAPANFPLVDIGVFEPSKNKAQDRLQMQEVKATRDDPGYFGACAADFEGLYATSRLASTVEHMKWDLQQAKRVKLIPRINDCVGTCPEDSAKVTLIPTGVSGDTADQATCVKKIESIVGSLKKKGWPTVRGMYLRIPSIEEKYKAFACGKGDTQ